MMNANEVVLGSGWWDRQHGENCDCRLLASAVGADPSATSYSFCRLVLQKRWRVRCEHGGCVSETAATSQLPQHDRHDMVQAILLVNAASPAG